MAIEIDADAVTWKPIVGNCKVDKVIETWDISLDELFNGSFHKFVECVRNLELGIVEMFETVDNTQVIYNYGTEMFQVVITYNPVDVNGENDLSNGKIHYAN